MQQKDIDKDQLILERFVEVYCRNHHKPKKGELCETCSDLLDYAHSRRAKCPYDPKPKCKECPTHCYRSDYRAKIKVIMRYSGIYYVKRGRLDWLIRYFLSKKSNSKALSS